MKSHLLRRGGSDYIFSIAAATPMPPRILRASYRHRPAAPNLQHGHRQPSFSRTSAGDLPRPHGPRLEATLPDSGTPCYCTSKSCFPGAIPPGEDSFDPICTIREICGELRFVLNRLRTSQVQPTPGSATPATASPEAANFVSIRGRQPHAALQALRPRPHPVSSLTLRLVVRSLAKQEASAKQDTYSLKARRSPSDT